MVRQDFSRGTEPGVFEMNGAGVGLVTCYEAAFDWAVRDTVTAGAQLISVPSNNATFGRSEMTYQQLAMSRVRAVEHSRAVTVPVTSGVSAFIMPDGKITQRTGMFVADSLVAEVPLRTSGPRPPASASSRRSPSCWSPRAGWAGPSPPECAGDAPVTCGSTPAARPRSAAEGADRPVRVGAWLLQTSSAPCASPPVTSCSGSPESPPSSSTTRAESC
ncbi:hypothetical protein SHKM778_57220 [Streptomyces sp. KM77-8]|uniref:CN hydrolase domain-containing protein n=1 Tax=Streptomyces haneummycinicus TaxID=3074435 RepID=A0AAT9HP77_9ACTN